MIDGAEKKAGFGLVHDEANAAADTHRAVVWIPGPVEPAELHDRVRRVYLQIECGCLGGGLLFAGQLGEAGCECVGDSEFHSAFCDVYAP